MDAEQRPYTWDDVWLENFEPCRKCSRRVKHPCHNAEGFYGSGPWDAACDMIFNPSKYE